MFTPSELSSAKDSVSETWASYTTFVVEHNGTPLDQVDHFINTYRNIDPRFRPPRPESTPVATGGPSTPQGPTKPQYVVDGGDAKHNHQPHDEGRVVAVVVRPRLPEIDQILYI